MAKLKASEKKQKAIEAFDNVRSEALDELERLTGRYIVEKKSGIQVRHKIHYHGRPKNGTPSYMEIEGLINCNASLQMVNFSGLYYVYFEVSMCYDGHEKILANWSVEFE